MPILEKMYSSDNQEIEKFQEQLDQLRPLYLLDQLVLPAPHSLQKISFFDQKSNTTHYFQTSPGESHLREEFFSHFPSQRFNGSINNANEQVYLLIGNHEIPQDYHPRFNQNTNDFIQVLNLEFTRSEAHTEVFSTEFSIGDTVLFQAGLLRSPVNLITTLSEQEAPTLRAELIKHHHQNIAAKYPHLKDLGPLLASLYKLR